MGSMLCGIALTATYVALAWLGLRVAFVHGTVSPVWPPTGLAIAALTVWGLRLWPAVTVGALLANALFAANPLPVAAGIAVGNTLEALLGALALRRLGVRGEVRQVRDGVVILMVALLAPLPSATGGAFSLTLGGFSPAGNYPWVWLVWWLGDFMGALIGLPLLLAWLGEPSPVAYTRRPLEFAGALLLAAAAVSFAYLKSDALAMLDVPFLPPSAFLFPPMVWAVLRLRPRETTLVLALGCALAVIFTRVFTEGETLGPLLWLQLVLLGVGGGSLLLVGALAERARAEQALHANEVRFRSIFEQAAVGITQVARDGRLLAVNQHLCELLGYEREALLGKTFEDITDPTFLDDERRLIDDLFAGRRDSYVIEKRYRRREGSPVWVRVTSSRPAGAGSVYRISIVEDISARQQAEEARRESEQRLAGLVGAAMDAIVSIDAEQRIVLFNAAAEAMFRCRREEALGTPIERFIPERFRAAHCRHVGAFLAEGTTARAMGQLQTLWGRRADGEEFPIEASISKTNVGGQWLATVIVRDITERKRLEEALRLANQELEQRVRMRTAELAQANEALLQSNQELRQFAYIASHDLQTPLRTITGCAQLLQRDCGGRLGGRTDDLIRRVVDGTHRMQRLIQDLLAYSAVETQARPFAPVDLGQVGREVTAVLADAIRESGAEVTYAGLPTVLGDRGQLAQLLQALIDNALKYRGEAPPQVRISAERQGDDWLVSVRDNGIGIPADQHERIFDVFTRLHTPQAYPGTGIGLAICRRVVERHGGRLWVESAPGQGTVFRFTLPAGRP